MTNNFHRATSCKLQFYLDGYGACQREKINLDNQEIHIIDIQSTKVLLKKRIICYFWTVA